MSRCRVLLNFSLLIPFQSPCSFWPSISSSDPDHWSNWGQLPCFARLVIPPAFFFPSPNVVVYQQRLTKTISLSFNDYLIIGYNSPFVRAQEKLLLFRLFNSFPNSSSHIRLGSSLSISPSSTCNETNQFLTESKYQTPSSHTYTFIILICILIYSFPSYSSFFHGRLKFTIATPCFSAFYIMSSS